MKRTLSAWYRHYKMLYFMLFLVVLGFGAWAWYGSLHRYSWNSEEKKAFIDSYAKETSFKETKFRDVVDRLKERARMHDEIPEIKRDIFNK